MIDTLALVYVVSLSIGGVLLFIYDCVKTDENKSI
jgi:hypothetical protein